MKHLAVKSRSKNCKTKLIFHLCLSTCSWFS